MASISNKIIHIDAECPACGLVDADVSCSAPTEYVAFGLFLDCGNVTHRQKGNGSVTKKACQSLVHGKMASKS